MATVRDLDAVKMKIERQKIKGEEKVEEVPVGNMDHLSTGTAHAIRTDSFKGNHFGPQNVLSGHNQQLPIEPGSLCRAWMKCPAGTKNNFDHVW